MTNAERLTRIETILEEKLAGQMSDQMDDMVAELAAIRKDLSDDKADLAALKNKGTGILIGVGLAASALGAGFSSAFKWLAGLVG